MEKDQKIPLNSSLKLSKRLTKIWENKHPRIAW